MSTPKQTFPDPFNKIFQSVDPTWRKWGILLKGKPTMWFNRKADAEKALKLLTKDQSLTKGN